MVPPDRGKGTVSRAAAQTLGWGLLDSGALYRLVALAWAPGGVDLDDGAALGRIATQFDIRFGSDPLGEEIVWLAGNDVTPAIRTESGGQRRLQSSRAAGGARGAPGAPAALCRGPGFGRGWARYGHGGISGRPGEDFPHRKRRRAGRQARISS